VKAAPISHVAFRDNPYRVDIAVFDKRLHGSKDFDFKNVWRKPPAAFVSPYFQQLQRSMVRTHFDIEQLRKDEIDCTSEIPRMPFLPHLVVGLDERKGLNSLCHQ
jgi:hypothetical protein